MTESYSFEPLSNSPSVLCLFLLRPIPPNHTLATSVMKHLLSTSRHGMTVGAYADLKLRLTLANRVSDVLITLVGVRAILSSNGGSYVA